MTNYTFTLKDTNFTINDLGTTLNSEFVKFYTHIHMNQPFNYLDFDVATIKYFDSHNKDFTSHNAFFDNFTILWRFLTELGRFREAESVWEFAISPVKQWEKINSPKVIHKGTPYYFRAMSVILSGDLDRGFLLMHQALVEDIRTLGNQLPDTPANAFVTLDYQKVEQAFRNEVLDTANFLDEFLTNYRNKFGNVLTLNEFRHRLFNIASLRDSIFLLVFTLSKVKSLIKKIDSNLRTNDFAGLIEIGTLFDLCLVIDSVIHYKNTTNHKYIDHMEFLSNSCSFSLSIARLKEINTAFTGDFSGVVSRLLSGTWTFRDGTNLSLSELDLALSYGLRNFSAHRIESIPVIYKQFEDIFQRIINVLFLSIEKLY